jgi:AraC family transcriptional regulator, melibiose operon regulatory protein
MTRLVPADFHDESVPAVPDMTPGYPVVIFGNDRLCAGQTLNVSCMPSPHMHSQIEFNFVLEGRMTYWFDGREISISAGRLALFWGMVPHQVVEVDDPTKFVCLYVPMSVFLGLPTLSRLRDAMFKGAVVEALNIKPFDVDIIRRWREELLSGEPKIEQVVREELKSRVRRIDLEGWRDLRALAVASPHFSNKDPDGAHHVERMARFIGEHATTDISVDDVAKVIGLHPNYATTLFKRGVGLSINQAIIRHRLDAAQSMLIGTDNTITSIAFDCGFGSLSRFYEAFHKRFNTTPIQFRRQFGMATVEEIPPPANTPQSANPYGNL